ncbi:uncharacterized protein V1518DRAFT_411815 [Limtongia smithiae]|uniref:uncharacterized protein n=1 Tax=Limtongia smithiae TaxID=1125753 RepID=UPI0034CF89B8
MRPLLPALLALAGAVLADGDHDSAAMSPGMAAGRNMVMSPAFNTTEFFATYDPTSFLTVDTDRALLMIHIALMCLAFMVLLPVSLMLSIAKSPLYTPIHLVFLSAVALAMPPIVVFKSHAPDLYPGNVHSKFGWVVLVLLIVHFCAGFFRTLLGWSLARPLAADMPAAGADQYTAVGSTAQPPRLSHDSAHAGSFAGSAESATLDGFEDEADDMYSSEFGYRYANNENGDREYVLETGEADELEKPTLPHHPLSVEYRVQQYIAMRFQPLRRAIAMLPPRLLASLYIVANVLFSLLNRPMVCIGFFQLCSGVITVTCTGRGDKVYGMLAHTIKGSVFMWFGILTFGRVIGAYANLGWAWNVRPPMSRAKMSLGARFFRCNIEMVESGLIFFYGCTNVFMEHLGNKDGKWSHKDLQHVSIAFMYFGGGLCGLLYESKFLRNVFHGPVKAKMPCRRSNAQQRPDHMAAEPYAYGFSFNPFPLFTVFFTGVLMSQHQQALELSTKVHMQWGYLFCVGSILRLMTYIIMYVSPPKSYFPSRPITETFVSFCLLAGGIIFMASNVETIYAMLYYGLDSMFTMNIAVGFTALLMAWIMVLMAIKGWATQRSSRAAAL